MARNKTLSVREQFLYSKAKAGGIALEINFILSDYINNGRVLKQNMVKRYWQ